MFSVNANRLAPQTYKVKGPEKTKLGDEERTLLRVEVTYPKELYLDNTTLWVDEDGRIVKQQEEVPMLFGTVTYEQSTSELAKAKFKPRVTDIETPIQVNKAVSVRRGSPRELVVRVALAGDKTPQTLFEEDGRQRVIKADEEGVELRLFVAPPAVTGPPAPAPAEYLESNFFIRSDDPLVRKLAADAVGEETDPREQLRLIRRFISRKVRGNYEVAFATADEVARSLEGDCSEMGILAAAMCRAVGIPSRAAFGLVYDPNGPGFGGHLWVEVYLDGQWETFDPTGVIPQVNAAYIKIASYSLKNVLNPEEFIAVRRAFSGRMKVEIVESK
jgi:hypothetical protein